MKISRIVTVSVLLLALCCFLAAPAFAKHGGTGTSEGITGGWGGAPPENPGAWGDGQHPQQNGVESNGIVELIKTVLITVFLM